MRLESFAGHTRTDEPKAGETQLRMCQISVFAVLLTLLKKKKLFTQDVFK